MLTQPPMSAGPASPSYRPEPVPGSQVPANPRFSSSAFLRIFGVILGLLIFIGFLTFQAVFLIQVPCTTGGCPVLTADQAAYSSAIHALAWIGMIALDLSVGLSVMVAFLLNAERDASETAQRSAFLFAAIYVAAFTVFTMFMASFLFSFLRFY